MPLEYGTLLTTIYFSKCGRVVCNDCSKNEATYLPSTYVVSPQSQIFLESPHVPHRTCDGCLGELVALRRALQDSGEDNNSNDITSTDNNNTNDTESIRSSETLSSLSSTNSRGSRDHRSASSTNGRGETFTNLSTRHARSSRSSMSTLRRYSNRLLHHRNSSSIASDAAVLSLTGESTSHSTQNHNAHTTSPVIDEESLCPVCGKVLYHLSVTDKESHIDKCLTKLNNDQPTQSPPWMRNRMVTYTLDGPLKVKRSHNHSNSLTEKSQGAESIYSVETTSSRSTTSNECVICFEEFEKGDKVARLECLCVYHHDCIKTWFSRKGEGNCPVHAPHT